MTHQKNKVPVTLWGFDKAQFNICRGDNCFLNKFIVVLHSTGCVIQHGYKPILCISNTLCLLIWWRNAFASESAWVAVKFYIVYMHCDELTFNYDCEWVGCMLAHQRYRGEKIWISSYHWLSIVSVCDQWGHWIDYNQFVSLIDWIFSNVCLQ